MNMPVETLINLLKGKHFSVGECKVLGVWPREILKYAEVANCLSSFLEKEDWFPEPLHTSEMEGVLREGIYIHRLGQQRYVCIALRTRANDPGQLAEQTEVEFVSAHDAVNYFLKWEFNLPGRLDGWSVE